MPHVLIASDAPWVHDEVKAALGQSTTAQSLVSGRAVRRAMKQQPADLVVLDSQMGNMGGVAVTLDLHNETSGGRLPHVPILLLLDRQPDVYLARNAKVEGYLVKPLDPMRLRRAITALLAGDRYEDRVQVGDASTNFRPTPDSVAR